jgi:chloramphenicol 3-O phosphotransferase
MEDQEVSARPEAPSSASGRARKRSARRIAQLRFVELRERAERPALGARSRRPGRIVYLGSAPYKTRARVGFRAVYSGLGSFIAVSGAGEEGQIVVLNGAPRCGKSSIVTAIQETLEGIWINIGVDVARAMTPPQLQPGIGLRPGEGEHASARHVPLLYAALYESIAAHSRLGLNVAVDVGHYDVAILADAARRLARLPVLFVGVRCPIEVIMQRRRDSEAGRYATAESGEPVPAPVLRWQNEVHGEWAYDLEVDTSAKTPSQCVAEIARRLSSPPAPSAFTQLAR